jgi:hypothetical protein
MAERLEIIIEINEKGAVTAVRNVQGELQKFDAGLRRVGGTGTAAMTGVTRGTEQARDAAQFLSRTFGVEVPRALEKVLAKSAILGPALAKAFGVGSVLLFATAVASAVSHFEDVQSIALKVGLTFDEAAQRLWSWVTGTESFMKVLSDAKRLQQLVLPLIEQERNLRREAAMAGLEGYAQIEQALKQQTTDIGLLASKQKRLAEEQILDEKARAEAIIAIDQSANVARLAAYEAAEAKLTVLRSKEQDEVRKVNLETLAMLKAQDLYLFEARVKLLSDYAAAAQQAAKAAEESATRTATNFIERAQSIRGAELDLAAERARLAGDSATAILLQEQKRETETISHLTQIGASEAELAHMRQVLQQQADVQIAEESRRRFQDTARTIEQFFDRVFLTARSFGDVFRQLWMQIAGFFVKQVAQMVAAWVMGQRQMAAVTGVGAGGGVLGGLLGGLFGGLGGGFGITGAGGTAPFFAGGATMTGLPLPPASYGLTLAGLPVSAGQGAGGIGTVLPAGAAAVSAGRAGGGILARLGGLGGVMGLLGLTGMSLLGSRNAALRGIGGFLTGGTIGLALGGAGLGLIGGLLGAVLPVVGAIIGGLIAIFGFGGPHKGDVARIQVMEPALRQIQLIKDAYNVFQLDYSSAISQLEQLRAQALQQLQQIGGEQVHRNSLHINQAVDQAEREINTTEAERARRSQLVFGGAMFEQGGLVSPRAQVPSAGFRVPSKGFGMPGLSHSALSTRHSAVSFQSGGAVPAVLHAGEFVMRRQAVQQIGRQNLEAMNRGGAGTGISITIQAWDGPSVEAWLRQGGAEKIARALWRAEREGAA